MCEVLPGASFGDLGTGAHAQLVSASCDSELAELFPSSFAPAAAELLFLLTFMSN